MKVMGVATPAGAGSDAGGVGNPRPSGGDYRPTITLPELSAYRRSFSDPLYQGMVLPSKPMT